MDGRRLSSLTVRAHDAKRPGGISEVHEGRGGRGKQPELTGGCLLRSLGGWYQVIARRRTGKEEEGDERILGGDGFVHTILKETEERELRALKLKRSGMTIRKIIDEECTKAGISPIEVMNGFTPESCESIAGRRSFARPDGTRPNLR